VSPTERDSAPALEPSQPHALPTRSAPVRLRRTCYRTRRHRNLNRNRDRNFCRKRRRCFDKDIDRRRRRRRGKRRLSGGGERGLDRGFGCRVVLLLQTDRAVAFGAEVHGGGATEEAAVVDAETVTFRSLASVFFRHVSEFGSVDLGFYFLFLLLGIGNSRRNRKGLRTCRNFPEKERETKKRTRLRFRLNPRKFKGEKIETLGLAGRK